MPAVTRAHCTDRWVEGKKGEGEGDVEEEEEERDREGACPCMEEWGLGACRGMEE